MQMKWSTWGFDPQRNRLFENPDLPNGTATLGPKDTLWWQKQAL